MVPKSYNSHYEWEAYSGEGRIYIWLLFSLKFHILLISIIAFMASCVGARIVILKAKREIKGLGRTAYFSSGFREYKVGPVTHEAFGAHEGEGEGEVAQSCPTLWDAVDCSLPGFSVHGILQARILEWITISFSRGSSQPRDQTWVSLIGSRCFNLRATRDWLIQIYEINLWQCSRLIYLLQMAIPIVSTPLPHFQQLIPLRLLSSNLAVSGKPLRLAAFKIYSIQWISKHLLCHWENSSILVLKSMKRQIPIQSSLSYSSTLAPGSCHLSVVRFQSLCPWSQWWMWQCGHAFLWSIGHSDQ